MIEKLHFHFSLSCIGEGNGNPLQYSCLENPREWGAWWAAVYRFAHCRTWLKWLSSSSSNQMKVTTQQGLSGYWVTFLQRMSSNVHLCGGKKNVFILWIYFKSFQPFSRVWLFATLWTAAHLVSLSITKSRSLFKLMSIVSVMPSNNLILCCPLLLLPSVFPIIRVFTNEPVLCIRWPKYCSFNFSISPSSGYSELISFWMDWLDFLAVPGTLKSLLKQFKSISSLVLSFLYSTTLTSIHDYWKNHSFDMTDLFWQSNVSAF